MKSIKGLALAALAAAALIAFPAAASASTGFVAGEYPATLKGSESTGSRIHLSINGSTAECEGLSFEATLKEHSPSVTTSSVKNPSCGFSGLEMKGCQLELDPGGTGSVAIGPSGCGPVSFWIFGCAGSFTIAGGTEIEADYENVGTGSEARVRIVIDDTSVEYVSNSNNGCVTKGAHSNLSLEGDLKIVATNGAGKPTGTSVVSGGLYVGEGSEGGQFEAADYPANVTGERLNVSPFIGKAVLVEGGKYNNKVSCEVAEYDGGELTESVSQLTLTATYSGCTLGANSIPVSMNSCRYVYSGLEYVSQGEFESTAEIVCNEGDAITAKTAGTPSCELRIPAQTLAGGTTGFANIDLENEASLLGAMNATGVKYTASNTLSCKVMGFDGGINEDGELKSDMLLHAEFPG